MNIIRFAKDVVPIGAFKAQAAAWLEHLRNSGSSIVITQNGKPAGILMSPAEYDRIQEKERFLESVSKGIADAEAGRLMTTAELRRSLSLPDEKKKKS